MILHRIGSRSMLPRAQGHARTMAAWLRPRRAGLVLSVAIGLLAHFVARWAPLVGSPLPAIVLGAATAPLARRGGLQVASGAGLASKYVLQAAIVLYGTGLSITAVLRVGASSLPVMLVTVSGCLVLAWTVGRALHLSADLRTLVGVGTGICGASAIAAVAPVIGASEAAIGYAMSTIFAFNLVAVAVFPTLGHLLGLTTQQFGLWAGTAINDTSSVTAAGYAYARAAGDYAVVVKLARTLMIVPITVGLAALQARARRGGEVVSGGHRVRLRRLVPAFLPAFLVAAVANTAGLVPAAAHGALTTAASIALAVAMAGIGLRTRVGDMRGLGARPFLLGGILSAALALSALGLQALQARLG